jgi:hypothetical protein
VNKASAQDGYTSPNVIDVTDVDVMLLETVTNPCLNVAPPMLPMSPTSEDTDQLKCDDDFLCHPEHVQVHSDSTQQDQNADNHENDEPAKVTIETEKQNPRIKSLFKSAKLKISNHIQKNQCKSDPKKRKRKTPRTSRKVVYYTKEMGYYRQCFQPRFEYPHSCSDLLTCKGADFLLVFVGLCNILLLQFILVVLMFFSQEEINQDTFKENTYSSSHMYGRPW